MLEVVKLVMLLSMLVVVAVVILFDFVENCKN